MLNFITSQFLFYLSLAFILFLPGYALLGAIFGRAKNFNALEKFIIAPGLGLIVTDFVAFTLTGIHLPISRATMFFGILVFSAICAGIYKYRLDKSTSGQSAKENLFSFSKNQFALIILLIFGTFFIKTIFLSGTIAPTATDMGHHMYWAKWMTESHKLPDYEGMPDFIIGEHIIFGTAEMFTALPFTSGWPVLILLLMNILSILTVFILTLRIFKNQTVAILTLFFLGLLYAIASPQAKFVSGGVIGNIMGNFLMPLAFYFYYRAFEFLETDPIAISKHSKTFLALAVFVTFGLFYTHHLTSFIFLFIFVMLAILLVIFNYGRLKNIFRSIFQMILSRQVIITSVIGLIFFFFIFTPTYVKGSAVGTAVGAPSKSTREGLTIDNIKSSIGEARLALGFLGLLIILFSRKRKSLGYIIAFAWALMLFVMTIFPKILFVNLPSSRIGNYLSYPLSILSALGIYYAFRPSSDSKEEYLNLAHSTNRISQSLIKSAFIVTLVFVFIGGITDSTSAFKTSFDNYTGAVETFSVSSYLAQETSADDILLKDHNYITADTWMKQFFMRGYKYPQSRGYFKRYDDSTKSRETCTLVMIANPDGDDAKKCFTDTKTNFILVNPKYDSSQFQKLSSFDQVYENDGIAVYYKK